MLVKVYARGGQVMLYKVDFAIKIKGVFNTIQSAFIQAISVSECQDKAEEIRDTLPAYKKHHIYIFIEA